MPFQTQLNAWAADDNSPTSPLDRIAFNQTLPFDGPFKVNALDSMYPRSVGQRTSLAVHSSASSVSYSRTGSYIASSTASAALPRLTSSVPSALSSRSAASTRNADFLHEARLLDVSSDDVNLLILPEQHLQANPDYPCVFEALNCSKKFDDAGSWVTHVLSHFRGHQPPSSAKCCLCGVSFADTPDYGAWILCLAHLARFHFRLGHTLATARPDFDTYRWMYCKGIIDNKTFSSLQLMASNRRDDAAMKIAGHVGRRDEPVVCSAGRRQERRQRVSNAGIASMRM